MYKDAAPIETIPEHLLEFVVEQDYGIYTAIDQAAWRFIMRVARDFFREHAHPIYEQGLPKTGITIDRIPQISEMDERLRKLGWRAVAVSGFIPSAVFLEFQALGILPIACDMRALERIEYTPAPDIVHEAAGHAPIVADPAYRKYLREYGEVARRAIFSQEDLDVYNAVRYLSDVKENPEATPEDVEIAEESLKRAVSRVTFESEAAWLSRMAWWTTEYGLVGDGKKNLIYGAGLLSSIGESYDCFKDKVKKVPFSVECVHQSFDITRPQPQLYVTPDFETLSQVLKELEGMMAFRIGGTKALERAKKAQTTTTVQYDSGLQVSGTLKDFWVDEKGQPAYLQFEGPTQISFEDEELEGQGAQYHSHGFGSPVGRIAQLGKSPAELSETELRRLGFQNSDKGRLEFESGVIVEGSLLKVFRGPQKDRNLLLIFTNCTVRKGDQVLFKPEWGTFDMACGSSIPSVFGGAADRTAYLKATGGYGQPKRFPKSNVTAQNRDLIPLYQRVREIREAHRWNDLDRRALRQIYETLESHFSNDWLLRLEILELLVEHGEDSGWQDQLRSSLSQIGKSSTTLATLIQRGLRLLDKPRAA